MKKTTLSKLVKQALKEILLEQKDFSKNRLRVSPKIFTDLSIPLTLKEQQEVEDSLKSDNDEAEKIFDFLKYNSEQGISLEKIANDSLLKNINIDGLGAIYKTIPTLTSNEFVQLLPDLTTNMTGVCTSQQSYGTINIYQNCVGYEVDDAFICCSGNNN